MTFFLIWSKLKTFADDKINVTYPIPTQSHLLTPLGNMPFENTVGKGEIARYQQFLLYPLCFLPIYRTFCYFHLF